MPETIYHDLNQAVSTGVLVRCHGLETRYHPHAELLCYINYFGPTGTFKDGLAEGMIRLAEEAGALLPGQPVVEIGHGSFAAALTLAGYRTGHPVTLVLPATAPEPRRKQLAALGAKLVLANSFDGRRGCEEKVAMVVKTQQAYYVNHCENDFNPEYHRRVTGPALLAACDNRLDRLVVGVGSGGTITGCGEYIKAWTNGVQVIGVEPSESRVLSGGPAMRHALEGIGLGFVPENYNPYIVDSILPVTTGDGKKFAGEALLCDGIAACPASGAVIGAALETAMDPANAGKRVIAIVGGCMKY